MVFTNDDEMRNLSNQEDNAGDGGKNHRHKNIKDGTRNKERKSHVPDAKFNEDKEDLFKLFIDASKKLGQQIKRAVNVILIDLGGKQIIDRFAQWCVQHPQLAICLVAAALVASLPILIFVAFALSTFVLTLTGFLFLEGTILTVITMMAFGLLGALGIFLLFCAFFGLATYFGISHVHGMFHNVTAQRQNLRNSASVVNAGGSANDNPIDNVSHERLN